MTTIRRSVEHGPGRNTWDGRTSSVSTVTRWRDSQGLKGGRSVTVEDGGPTPGLGRVGEGLSRGVS